MYIKSLCNEISYYKNNYDIEPVTIYIGGGNPSADITLIEKILNLVSSNFNLRCIKEYTVECNPSNVNIELLNILKSFSVNRISVGIQSFTNKALLIANRKGQDFETIDKVSELINNFNFRYSFDLISGLPGFNKNKDLVKTKYLLDRYKNINHASIYRLSIDEGSAFYYKLPKNIPNEKYTEKYEHQLAGLLKSYGFHRYEISNWCRKGYESLHNLSYWEYKNYIGLGPAAHGKINNTRIINKNSIIEYNKGDYKEITHINKTEYVEEILLMGLRIITGVNLKNIFEYLTEKSKNNLIKTIDKYTKYGYLTFEESTLKSTEKGWDILNQILADLFIYIETE